MSQKVKKSKKQQNEIKVFKGFLVGLAIGVLFGMFIIELGADAILHSTLDEVCIQLYGENVSYDERGISQAHFVCVKEPIPGPELSEPPRVRLE